MPEKYIISYRLIDGRNRVLFQDGKIETHEQLPNDVGRFIMLSVNDNVATDESLKEYGENFKIWCEQLKNSDLKIDYANYYSDYTAVTCVFNRFCLKFYKEHQPISTVEYEWMDKCPNYGLQYIDTKVIKKTIDAYSYDYKNQYAQCLCSDYKIPSKQGKEIFLQELDMKNLQYGYYHVKVISDNENFKKIFSFSKNNVYHYYSLKLACKYKEKFDVKFELEFDDKPNAYVYEDNDLVKLNSITRAWYNNFTKLRNDFKKQGINNRLIKHLISTAWGHLNAKNVLYKSWDEIQNENLTIGTTNEYPYKIIKYYDYGENGDYYELLKTDSPYKHNIRLKPTITAISRIMTAEIVLKDIENVVRIQTDSITFTTEKKDIINASIIEEEKTTGKLYFKNLNKYHNKTTNYKTKNYNVKDDDEDLVQSLTAFQ